MRIRFFGIWLAFSSSLASAAMPANIAGTSVSAISFEILDELPHDNSHYTQGLLYDDGRLIENTGLYGESALFELDLRSARILRKQVLPRAVFGEGAALLDGTLHVLTWREQRGFLFSRSFEPRGEFRYSGEGWGLTTDGRSLIFSDGSSQLLWLDPKTHAVLRALEVRDGERPVELLNELEYAHGWILANIWRSDRVAMIDPASGRVAAWIDLSPLRQRLAGRADAGNAEVLNGLAYNPASDVLYATGKRWPRLFALRLHWPATDAAAAPSMVKP